MAHRAREFFEQPIVAGGDANRRSEVSKI